jgi:cold-inducible RNA-binding protein
MPKKLYIGNLSYEITDDELHQVFSQCGQVLSAKVVKDRDSGQSKGFGFVEMPNDDEATHAVDRMNGFDLKGRALVVDIAREPEKRVRGRY